MSPGDFDAVISRDLERTCDALIDAWGSWGPSMTPAADRVAYISDRTGRPSVWVQDMPTDDTVPAAVELRFTEDPVTAVSWSADESWLACAVATDGGVRQQVWVVRPDGSDARRIAGSTDVHAEMGPWTRSGHRVVVTIPPVFPGDATYSYLADPATGELHPLAEGDLISVMDVSTEERIIVVRDGQRGRHFCVSVDRVADDHLHLTAKESTGTTESAILRPSPVGAPFPLVAYLVTDVGLDRKQLMVVPMGPAEGHPQPELLATRTDAELEEVDADDAGRLLILVWNVDGATELELLDTTTGSRESITDLPGTVASDVVLSRDGRSVVLSVEGAEQPKALFKFDISSALWTRVTDAPLLDASRLVQPTLERFDSEDGLSITGWLYRGVGDADGRALVWLHGGPEAQERPGFSAQHQAFAAAGISVFALNVRGSSGFGRAFVHADEGEQRDGAFADVRAAAEHLVATGVADARRLGVAGRSYGGYLTLAMLAFFPGIFAAGIDICGMSDLRTFYRDTEPWIASAAYSKYGHPRRDRALLKRLSPLRAASAIEVPLLVVHGERDTNVPIGEARQIVAALERRDRPIEYLEVEGEGHEYRLTSSRRLILKRLLGFAGTALPSG